MPRAQRAKGGNVKVYGHPKDAQAFNAKWPGAAIPPYTMAEFDRRGDLIDVQGVPDTEAGTAFVADLQAYAARQGLQPKRNPAIPKHRRDAIMFFQREAGYATPPGRMGSAKALADAEAHADAQGWTVEWEEDQGMDWSWREGGAPDYPGYVAILRDADGHVLASVGGVDLGGEFDPRHPYARVIAAELAAEAMPRKPLKLGSKMKVIPLREEDRENPRVREIGRLVHSYDSAKSFLRGKMIRKLANNTTVEAFPFADRTIGVRLHRTVIVDYHPDGRVVLNSGGWDTPTTRQRIRELLPVGYYLQTDRGQWYVASGDRVVPFEDMMTLHPDGRMTAQDGRELTPVRLTPGGRVSMRSNPPGKYEGTDLLGQLLHVLASEGADEELGDVEGFGWHGLMTGVTRGDLDDAADEADLSEEWHTFKQRHGPDFPVHAIISEDSLGFVDVQEYDTMTQARRAWKELEREYDDFMAESDDDD